MMRKWLIFFFFAVFHSDAKAQDSLIADLGDHLVAITTGFTGANMLLFGAIDAPADIIAVVRGPETDVQVRRKEKLAGIWVNKDAVEFQDVPAFYDIASTRPIEQLLDSDILEQYRLGVTRLQLVPDTEDPGDMFKMALLRLKKQQQLYRDQQSQIIFIGGNLFRLNIHLPASIIPGAYTVEVYSVRDGEIIAAQTTPLIVSKVGLGADIYQFAIQHSVYYGLSAIAIALFLGWMGHLIFRRS